MFVALLISKPSKKSASQTILLPCNSKGLIFDFYLNRKQNKCWLAAYSFALFTWQYSGRDASSVIYDLSHNFAGYVINTVGLEDIGCRWQIAGWLQAENFENSVWKSAEVIPVRILQWFSDSLRLFRFDKMNTSFTSLLCHWPKFASKWYSISFIKSGILLQQLIALLEGVSAHVLNVYCTILKEMRGREIFNVLGRRHISRWTHSPKTRSWNKMAVFWCNFRDFVGSQKIEDLTESKNFFAE